MAESESTSCGCGGQVASDLVMLASSVWAPSRGQPVSLMAAGLNEFFRPLQAQANSTRHLYL